MASNKSAEPTIRAYIPTIPTGPFPYSASDMTPMDAGNDTSFYKVPRLLTHIDDNAIIQLKQYYDKNLPKKGFILDFCSSWVSHYPPSIEQAAKTDALVIVGMGLNKTEMSHNPVLKAWSLQDLNEDPELRLPQVDKSGTAGGESTLDASTCVVSIDYLTKPVEVLSSIRKLTKEGGTIHLSMSNRCFPTKVVGRWLKVPEEERLKMVGDYLHWAGWKDTEIVTVIEKNWMYDPLWVVRATKRDQEIDKP